MNVVERARSLLLTPGKEWDDIADEAITVPELYRNWIAIVAAIPVVATFVGISVIGVASYRVPLVMGIVHAAVSYALALGSVYALALVIDALAPSFGAHRNFGQAFKVAAFSPAAAWIAGVFGAVPALSPLALLGLYSLYLLHLGLPRVMNSPPDRSLSYAATVTLAALVMYVVVVAVTGFILPGSGALR